jgi:hypothetical protein
MNPASECGLAGPLVSDGAGWVRVSRLDRAVLDGQLAFVVGAQIVVKATNGLEASVPGSGAIV